MAYSIIQPPFPTLEFHKMSRPELERYAAWFMEVMPERIAGLEAAVRESSPSWRADDSPQSLALLGEWFAGQVEARPRSEQEMEAITSRLKFPIDVPSEELTERTFSLAMDVGMYFGRVVASNLPGARWDQSFKNRRDSDYGQPIVVGFGDDALNPVWIAVTLAYGIASGNRSGDRLRELYDVWSGAKST